MVYSDITLKEAEERLENHIVCISSVGRDYISILTQGRQYYLRVEFQDEEE